MVTSLNIIFQFPLSWISTKIIPKIFCKIKIKAFYSCRHRCPITKKTAAAPRLFFAKRLPHFLTSNPWTHHAMLLPAQSINPSASPCALGSNDTSNVWLHTWLPPGWIHPDTWLDSSQGFFCCVVQVSSLPFFFLRLLDYILAFATFARMPLLRLRSKIAIAGFFIDTSKSGLQN